MGQLLKVMDNELIPADLVCLYSGVSEGVAFVRTTNLDGETNLKIKGAVDLKDYAVEGWEQLVNLSGKLECDPPSRDLMTFKGRLELCQPCQTSMGVEGIVVARPEGLGQETYEVPTAARELERRSIGPLNARLSRLSERGQRSVSLLLGWGGITHPEPPAGSPCQVTRVTMNEVLLRGCVLKNTNFVVGLVVYTGQETRIQMNASGPPLKVGSFDHFLNLQIGIIIAMQVLMCVLSAVWGYYWRESQLTAWYLQLDQYINGNWENPGAYMGLSFLTFWILYSYLVPISLFVTLEIVKFWQAFVFINSDPHMVYTCPLPAGDSAGDDEEELVEPAKARNSNLNEDLGMVQYVFCDKTGTLTQNEMRLRRIAIKDAVYGSSSFRLEDHPELSGPPALHAFDSSLYEATAVLKRKGFWIPLISRGGSSPALLALGSSNLEGDSSGAVSDMDSEFSDLSQTVAGRRPGSRSRMAMERGDSPMPREGSYGICEVVEQGEMEIDGAPDGGSESGVPSGPLVDSSVVLGHHVVDFWSAICLCHSLIIETDRKTGEKVYQGPSPDEVALVEAARQLGFQFIARGNRSITVDMQGHQTRYTILNVLEFSSERKRMSVIVKAPNGVIRMFCKGADSAMLTVLDEGTDPQLLANTRQNLHKFSVEGLRTLMVATKIIDRDEYEAWDGEFQAASSSLDEREERMEALIVQMEQGLQLVGITGIEDKLQVGVPETLQSLLEAGIHVWMITGDKQETAINIGTSCCLLKDADSALICNATNQGSAHDLVQSLLARVAASTGKSKKLTLPSSSTNHSPTAAAEARAIPFAEGLLHSPRMHRFQVSGGRADGAARVGVLMPSASEVTGSHHGVQASDGHDRSSVMRNGEGACGVASPWGTSSSVEPPSHTSGCAQRPLVVPMSRELGREHAPDKDKWSLQHQADPGTSASASHELVIDGQTLTYILGTPSEPLLAELCAHCSSVLVCRASPSQKASMVRMMRRYLYDRPLKEAREAAGWRGHIPFYTIFMQYRLRMQGKLLAIGDGANDVAMIQAADVGIGIMGKEGRQAVNNADYAIAQFRYLKRLLFVHGSLSYYRLSRLIKYSFLKNTSYGFVLFMFQFYCGFSGQTLVDDISGAAYNVLFTALPILAFSILDRHLDPHVLMSKPQVYNSSRSLTTISFWKDSVLYGLVMAVVCFFVPLYGMQMASKVSMGVWTLGKVVYLSLLGAITIELGLVTRSWTTLFAVVYTLSFLLVFPFLYFYRYIMMALQSFYGQALSQGMEEELFEEEVFWLVLVLVYCIITAVRLFERAVKWSFHPDVDMVLSRKEWEAKHNEGATCGCCVYTKGEREVKHLPV